MTDELGPLRSPPPLIGLVRDFDVDRGLGTVLDQFERAFDFHATAVADGSRVVEVGAKVAFALAPGHRGRMEARRLVVIDH